MGRRPAFDDLERPALKREVLFDAESAQAIIDETHFVVSADELAGKLNRAAGRYRATCLAASTAPRDAHMKKRLAVISKQAAALAESLDRLSPTEKTVIDLPYLLNNLQRDAAMLNSYLGEVTLPADSGGRAQGTRAMQALILELAEVFEEITGRQSFTAWTSDDGSSGGFFLDFVVLCLQTIEPREAGAPRRAALVKTIQRTVRTT